MSASTVQPSNKSVEEILGGPTFIVVPRFQRPYAWESEQIADFWEDALKNATNGYFIGPMVVYDWENPNTVGLVDGQQRLTTVTLILCAIRDELIHLESEDLAEAAHVYIQRPDRDRILRFVLTSDAGRPDTWIKHIQSLPNDRVGHGNDDPGARAAFDQVIDLLEADLAEATTNCSRPETIAKHRVSRLKKLRDRLLDLRVVWLPLETEDEAYVVFESLNTRGKQLELVDRVKNHFLGHLRQAAGDVDEYKRRFNELRELFEGQRSDRDVNRYIHHWWLAQSAYVSEHGVFREMCRSVKESNAATFFDRFEADAAEYRKITDPVSHDWTQEQRELREALVGLRTMKITQPMPFVLAMFVAYRDRSIKIDLLRKALKTVEVFHFHVSAISTRTSSGGISKLYAKHGRELTQASEIPNPQKRKRKARAVIEEAIAKLVERRPAEQEFVDSFCGRLRFDNDYTRQKPLVQYVLRSIHSHQHPNTPANFEQFAIEHLMSQKEISDDSSKLLISNIGNLFLLPTAINASLGSKSFEEKKKILGKCKAEYDLDDVLAADSWGREQINARANRLARLAYAEIWAT